MATKDSFDAFVNIVRDKIDEFSENVDPVSYTHLTLPTKA